MKKLLLSLTCVLACALTATSEELPLGEMVEGSTTQDDMTAYTFQADGAGVLTVVAHSTDDTDIKIIIADNVGQPLYNAQFDLDYRGDSGSEYGAAVIPREGEYQVMISPTYGAGAEYEFTATWAPFESLESPADPDGSPGTATDLGTGEWIADSLDYQGEDYYDWYRIEAPGDGLLIVRTRGEEGDLVLEAYTDGQYLDYLDYSDQDLDDENARESITLDVEEGDVYYFKVRAYYGDVDYEIRATFAE